MSFHDFLEELIATAGSQRALAQDLGVDDSTVSRWRSGEVQPAARHFAALGERAGLTPYDVLAIVCDLTPVRSSVPAAIDADLRLLPEAKRPLIEIYRLLLQAPSASESP